MATIDDVEGIDFDVHFVDGTYEEFRSEDAIQYQWAASPDGSLFIYQKEVNLMFKVTTKDARIHAFAANYWTRVDVIPREDAEVPLTNEAEVIASDGTKLVPDVEPVISDDEAEATLQACLDDKD